MKKYFIIFDAHPHKVNWRELYNPNAHELILLLIPEDIGLSPSYQELEKKNQLKYFLEIIKLTSINYENLKQEILKIISNLKKSGIKENQIEIIGDGEICLLKAARLREAFNLKGPKPEQVIHFRNKVKAKEKLKESGLENFIPKYIHFNGEQYKKDSETYLTLIIDKLDFPVFAKPIDLVSSINTKKIENREQLKKWCEINQNNSFMELDQYIEGIAYHCDSFIKDGKIIRVDIGQKINPSANFLLGQPNGSLTLPRTNSTWERIYDFNNLVLKSLAPPDGCTDLDLFITTDNKIIFLECAARTPSEFIPEMYEASTGINYYQAHYQLQMQLDFKFTTNTFIPCAWIVIPPKKGILKEKFDPIDLTSEYFTHWKSNPGDKLDNPVNLIKYVCLIILKNNNYEHLKTDILKLNYHQFFSIQLDEQEYKTFLPNDDSFFIRNLFDN